MERASLSSPPIKHLKLKAGLLLAAIPAVVIGLAVYGLYGRGAFEAKRTLALQAKDAEGVNVGMPVTFSGFQIGSVDGLALTDDGKVRVEVRIREKDARWLRQSSTFTLERQLLGSARIRVITPDMREPQLEDGALRELVSREAAEGIPQLVARVNGILDNVDALVRADSSLRKSLASLQSVAARMDGEYGVLGGLTGSDARAKSMMDSIARLDRLLASADSAAARVDAMLAKSDARLFGSDGVLPEAQRAMAQVNAVLTDTRESLKKADAVLASAQAAAADVNAMTSNVKSATDNIGTLRAEVEASIEKLDRMLREINRKWPFARESEMVLP
jgi:phospholipid/cholesterol/gamma-HCH transport system substrate-binding protein